MTNSKADYKVHLRWWHEIPELDYLYPDTERYTPRSQDEDQIKPARTSTVTNMSKHQLMPTFGTLFGLHVYRPQDPCTTTCILSRNPAFYQSCARNRQNKELPT